MGDFSLDNNGKAGKLNQENFKGGIKRDQLKEKKFQQLFDFADKNNDGILDSSETDILMKALNTDDDMSEISSKEAKAYLKNAVSDNKELKNLKKDDLFNFLKELSQAGENIASSKFSEDAEGNKTIYITYKDGTVETVFPDESREITTTENGTKTTGRYTGKTLVSQTVETDEETTTVEYAADGTTTEKQTITSKKDNSKKTITYADGKPASAVVENGITQVNYTYDENGNEVKTSKIENKGIPAKEKRTDYTYDENGTETAVTSEQGRTSTTVTQKDGSAVTTEKDDDGSDITTTVQDGATVKVTEKPDGTKLTETKNGDKTVITTQNSDGTSTEVVTDESGNSTTTKFNSSGKRTEQTIVKDGMTYSVKYDGRGNTYITVQNGESPAVIAKKFHITTKTLLGMNKYNTDGLGNKYFQVGKTIKVPGEYDADNKLLTSRKSAQEAKNDYVSSGAAARETAVREEASERKNVTWTEKVYNRFEDIARSLYKQEGVNNPSQMQLSRRVKDLKKLNPNLKDGQLKGKKITAGVNPKRYEQVETAEKARENKKAQQKAAAENAKVQKQSGAQIAQDLIKSTNGYNDIDAMEKAIAKIDTPEELAEVNRLLEANGYKADDKYSPLEKFIYEEHNHTYVHTYNSSDYLEQIVQKQINNGTLKGDAANKAQARMACRVIFDGGDGFGTDCNKIKKGVRMIKCPKATGNTANDKAAAKAVYEEVNRIVKNHNTFYGLGSKCKNLVDYCEGEMWTSEVNYLRGILAENNSIQGEEKAKAVTDLTRDAVEGAGTDIEALQQAIKAIDSPADRKAVEAKLKEYCQKKGIQPKIAGQSYLQAVLYDECDTFLGISTDHKEIRKFNEMLIKQGAYTEEEAVKIRAEQAALQVLDGGFDGIKDALSNITDPKVLAKMNELLKTKNYNGIEGFVANKFKNDKTKQDLLLAELAANKLLPDNQAASIALRLVQNSDFDTRAKGLGAIRTEAQAKAVDNALKTKGSSLSKVYEQFNKEKVQYKTKAKFWDGLAGVLGAFGGSVAEHISDKYRENTDVSDNLYVEASKAQSIPQEKKAVYDAAVKDFEERLTKMKEDYKAALGSQGVISGAINEFCSIYNIGTTRDEIEARIEHDTETLRLMKLAANGKLAKMVDGKQVAVSFEDMFNDRQSNISGANGIGNTGNVNGTGKTKFDTKKITEVNKHANQIAAMDLAKDQIGQTWNELSDAIKSNDSARLSTAIYSSLTKLSQMSGKQMSLEALGLKLQNGKVVDKNGNAVTADQLKTIANQLKQGLSDISSTLLGQKIPMNAGDNEVSELLDKGYENKLEQFKQEYRAAYNQEPPDDLLDSYKSTIETGVMVANIGVSIGAVIAAPFTGGGSLAVFCAAAGSTLVMQGLEQSTDDNGWTNDEWTKTTVDAAWNGALAVVGMKVGMIADKAAQGGYKIAASAIAKQEKVIRALAPNLSAEKLRVASIIVARAEAAGFEVTSDALQSVVQTYCVKGEFDPQQFTADLLVSIAGNVAGHITSAIGDIKGGKGGTTSVKPDADTTVKPDVDPSVKPDVDPTVKPDIDSPSIKQKTKDRITAVKNRVLDILGIGPQAKAAKLKKAQIEAIASIVDANGNPRFSADEIADFMTYIKTDISPETLKAMMTNTPSASILSFENLVSKIDTPQKAKLAGILLEADATGAKKWNLDIFDIENIVLNPSVKIDNYEQFITDLMNSDILSYFPSTYRPSAILGVVLDRVETNAQKEALDALLDVCKRRGIKDLSTSSVAALSSIETTEDVEIFAKYLDKYLKTDSDGNLKEKILDLYLSRVKSSSPEEAAKKREILKFSLENERLTDIYSALSLVGSDMPADKIMVDYMLKHHDIPAVDIELMRMLDIKTDLQKQAFEKLLEAGKNKFEAYYAQEIINRISDEHSLNLLTDLLNKGYDANTIVASLKKGSLDTTGIEALTAKNNALRAKASQSLKDNINKNKIPPEYRAKVTAFATRNPKRYLKMEEAGLFDLIESGKINSGILDNIGSNSFLSNRTLAELRRIKNNEPYVKTLSSTADISSVGNGNVCEINGKLYVNDNGNALQLNISKQKFEELFPPLTSVTFKQGSLGDCWLVSGIDNYMDLPSGRVALYKLLRQEGNDIFVQFPSDGTTAYPPIRFENGQVLDANGVQIRGTQPGAPVGVQMIEQAYAVHRSKSYTSMDVNTPTDMATFAANPKSLMENLRGGWTADVNRTILGHNDGDIRTNNISSKQEMKEAIEKYANDENTILYFGTKGKDDTFWLDESYDIVENHAYAIKGYDPETGMVYITNPHHAEVITEVPMSEFLKHVSDVGYAEIKPNTGTAAAASAQSVQASQTSSISDGSVSREVYSSAPVHDAAPQVARTTALKSEDLTTIGKYAKSLKSKTPQQVQDVFEMLAQRIKSGEIPSKEMLDEVLADISSKSGIDSAALAKDVRGVMSFMNGWNNLGTAFRKPAAANAGDANLAKMLDKFKTKYDLLSDARKAEIQAETDAKLKVEEERKAKLDAELKAKEEAAMKAKQEAELKAKQEAQQRADIIEKFGDKYPEVVNETNFRDDATAANLIKLMENYDINMNYNNFNKQVIYSEIYQAGITNDADMDIAFKMIKERFHADVIARETHVAALKSKYNFYADASVLNAESIIDELKSKQAAGQIISENDIDEIMANHDIYDVRDCDKIKQMVMDDMEIKADIRHAIYDNPDFAGYSKEELDDAVTILNNLKREVKNGKPLTQEMIDFYTEQLDQTKRANGSFVSSEAIWALQEAIKLEPDLNIE